MVVASIKAINLSSKMLNKKLNFIILIIFMFAFIFTITSLSYRTVEKNIIEENNTKQFTDDITKILENQKLIIDNEMNNFLFADNKTLVNLTLNTGGTPYRSFILTTWRAGSTFFSELLNSMPGTYLHYEPLNYVGPIQVREPPLLVETMTLLKNLFQCNYTNLTKYIEYSKQLPDILQSNSRLWDTCIQSEDLCFDPNFLNAFCKLFPLQVMKTVRLRLFMAESLLLDESMGVKIIYLVRDPRGIMQSRKHHEWCVGECDNPTRLCGDLVADYYIGLELMKLYPDRFRVVRYEDLSLNIYPMAKSIIKFYGLPYHPLITKFLATHTSKSVGGKNSIYRDSKVAAFSWMKQLNSLEILNIESKCSKAMQVWGYKRSYNGVINAKTFNPILPLNLTPDENFEF